MRILHLCLACFYIDQYNYQENVLPRLAKEKGHEVEIIASTETFIDNKNLGYTEPGRYLTEYDVPIVRLPYKKVFSIGISHKLRIYKGLYDEIVKFAPDLIFSHDINYLSLDEVVRYKKNNPQVTLLADTHTGLHNSGKSWISLNILHKLIYKPVISRSIKYIKKVFYVGHPEKIFLREIYGIPAEKIEFMPLGGVIPSSDFQSECRKEIRGSLQMKEDELLLVHSGKLDKEKRTKALLAGFSRVKNLKARLVIIGSISDDIKPEITDLIDSDERISYLGWKNSAELIRYLCACDIYCQPGSPSATLQNAICCGSAIMANPIESYKDLDCGNFLWIESEADIELLFSKIASGEVDVQQVMANSVIFANRYLDYNKMEERIREEYEGCCPR